MRWVSAKSKSQRGAGERNVRVFGAGVMNNNLLLLAGRAINTQLASPHVAIRLVTHRHDICFPARGVCRLLRMPPSYNRYWFHCCTLCIVTASPPLPPVATTSLPLRSRWYSTSCPFAFNFSFDRTSSSSGVDNGVLYCRDCIRDNSIYRVLKFVFPAFLRYSLFISVVARYMRVLSCTTIIIFEHQNWFREVCYVD